MGRIRNLIRLIYSIKRDDMAKFKLIISYSDGKSQVADIEGTKAQSLIGMKIGESIDGSVAGLAGLKLQITGGSDTDGFPMRKDVHGGGRVATMLSGGTGFSPTRKGERRRKLVRGSVITSDIYQINLRATKKKENKKKNK